jgi:hypothetical protein
MHIGKMSWSSSPLHGATTENTKRYIDFAAANGLETGCAFGMSADLGADQLASIEQALRDAIEDAQEAERSKRWPCGIGPYANGICTICGGAQP